LVLIRNHWTKSRWVPPVLLLGAGSIATLTGTVWSRWKVGGWVLALLLLAAALTKFLADRGENALKNASDRRARVADLIRRKFHTVDGRIPRVTDLDDPILAGVHRTARGNEQTEYQPRAVDDDIDRAVGRGGIVVIHGHSTAGKSRAAYEAIRRVAAGRYFVKPSTVGALDEITKLGFALRDAIVWLDDFNPPIDQSLEDLPAMLTALVPPGRSDVTIILTMWESTWQQPRTRALRGVVEDLRISRSLTTAERRNALARTKDPLVLTALRQNDFGLAEYVAAGPAIYDAWQGGREMGMTAAAVGAAIVSAAVDCWRIGYHQPLSAQTLRRTYRSYLPKIVAAHPKLASFADGVEWAMSEIAGAGACLLSDGTDAYRPFDYLVDKARDEIDYQTPEPIIEEVGRLLDESSALDVATSALDVGHLALAERAATVALSSGSKLRRATAANLRGRIEERRGNDAEAEEWFRKASRLGDPDALARQGGQLEGVSAARTFERARTGRTARRLIHIAERRPVSLDPAQLGFVPQRAIAWLEPFLLLARGIRALLFSLLGSFLDRRDAQNSFDDVLYSAQDVTDLTIDFVVNAGDGFHATYSTAHTLARPHLDLDGRPVPRGDILIMGGNQVPFLPSRRSYTDRCTGPYAAAYPVADDEPARLFALPGRGDWDDGLSAFLRVFAAGQPIGGWATEQHRGYFAIQLNPRWWLLAVDDFGGDVDMPQWRYFERAAARMRDDHRVIICLPEATWLTPGPEPYESTDRLIRQLIAPTGARVSAVLAGGPHFYSRFEQTSGGDFHRQLITCGGSSYAQGATRLPDDLDLPPRATIDRNASPRQRYALRTSYPDRRASAVIRRSIFRTLPLRNPGFATMLGFVHAMLMLAMAGAVSQGGNIQRLMSIPLIIVLAAIMAFTILLAEPRPHSAAPWILGIIHGLAQTALGAGGTWIWLYLPMHDWSWPGPLIVAAVVYAPLAGLAASLLTAAWLFTADRFGVATSTLYAAGAYEGYDSFLRLRFDPQGEVTIYPVALDRICRNWIATPEAPTEAPWFSPAESLSPHLIEPPITLD
jgi:hypothetical protein